MNIEPFLFKNAIEVMADKCKCGGNIRLHTHVFGMKEGRSEVKFYVDCTRCEFVSGWVDSPDKCLA